MSKQLYAYNIYKYTYYVSICTKFHSEPKLQDDDNDKEDYRLGTSQGMPQSGRPLSPVEVSSLLAVTTDTYGDDDDYAGSVMDVAEIGNFLQNAPGRLCPYSLT